MKVVGLDLSLTSTGLGVITEHGATVDRVTSTGRAGASLSERADRLRQLRDSIRDWARLADLAVIEGPSYGQGRQGGQHDRAGLWWLVVEALDWRVPVVEVTPAARAKYATGKGNASKDGVLSAVVRRYPLVEVTGNDEADALVLAAMGARWLEHPIEPSLPQPHLDAMTKVRWPEGVAG